MIAATSGIVKFSEQTSRIIRRSPVGSVSSFTARSVMASVAKLNRCRLIAEQLEIPSVILLNVTHSISSQNLEIIVC
jgi:hypothetical protein